MAAVVVDHDFLQAMCAAYGEAGEPTQGPPPPFDLTRYGPGRLTAMLQGRVRDRGEERGFNAFWALSPEASCTCGVHVGCRVVYGQMEKHSQEEVQTGRKTEKKKVRKEMQAREKVGQSRNLLFFQMFCGLGGSKSRLAKAAGAKPAGQMKNENCTPLWRKTQLEVNRIKK